MAKRKGQLTRAEGQSQYRAMIEELGMTLRASPRASGDTRR
jgi:hypothetical protein